ATPRGKQGKGNDGFLVSSLMQSEDGRPGQTGAARMCATSSILQSEDESPRSAVAMRRSARLPTQDNNEQSSDTDVQIWTTTSTPRPPSESSPKNARAKSRARTMPERPGTTPRTTRPQPSMESEDARMPTEFERSISGGGRPATSGSMSPRKNGAEKGQKKRVATETRVNLPMLMSTKDDMPSPDTSPQNASSRENRKPMSFVDVSMGCIGEAIQEDFPGVDWLPDFWSSILLGAPTAVCKTLALRSLGNWVGVFNRWQEIGKWVPGQAPNFINAFEMQELLAIPMPKVLEFVKLFDPSGYAKLQMMKSAQDYSKVRLNMPAFLTACIWMSTSISKKQKIRFLLGVFDENDSYTFEEVEFVAMLVALFRGVGAIFGLVSRDAMPSHIRMQALAKKLFARVLELGESRTEGASKVLLANGSVPFHVVEEWLLGETYDPLNVPVALFMERYSVPGQEEDPEQFEDEERKFRVSHTCPVDPPMETAASLDGSFLSRDEVVLVNEIFKHCASQGSFSISHADAERAIGIAIDPSFWIGKLHRALDEMDDSRLNGAKMTLTTFLKKLCPQAAPRHLRMFHSWLKEHEQIDELRAALARRRGKLAEFKVYIAKPPLPAKIRQELLGGLESGSGSTSPAGRARGYSGQDEGVLSENKDDYLERMCPIEFRAHPGHSKVDDMFGLLLQTLVSKAEVALSQKERLFVPKKAYEPPTCVREMFVKPKVSEEKWQQWNQALDLLQVSDKPMPLSEFHSCRSTHPELEPYVYESLVGGADGLTREVCLSKMCELTNCRGRMARRC
ncbi:unnamed protein product, partial [Symbiodinium natans]